MLKTINNIAFITVKGINPTARDYSQRVQVTDDSITIDLETKPNLVSFHRQNDKKHFSVILTNIINIEYK